MTAIRRTTVGGVDINEFVALETEVWQALVDGDAGADERLLADDFLGVYPTGFAVRDDHVGQLAAGFTVQHFALSDARLVEVSDAAYLLSYRAVYQRAGRDRPEESMYVSSLWCRRDGHWLNTFSQDTPTGAGVV